MSSIFFNPDISDDERLGTRYGGDLVILADAGEAGGTAEHAPTRIWSQRSRRTIRASNPRHRRPRRFATNPLALSLVSFTLRHAKPI